MVFRRRRINSSYFDYGLKAILGYDYWHKVSIVDWDIDDFKAAYPEINIKEIPEV